MEKKKYFSPLVELIVLDNEISLALESNPPVGPDEGNNLNNGPDFLHQSPLKTPVA